MPTPRTAMTSFRTNPRRVFLVRGTGSCGTSWLTALLNLHPRVFTCGEWCFAPIQGALARWEGQAWTWGTSERMRRILRDRLAEAVSECLNTVADGEKPAAEWVGDCSPDPVSDLVPGAPVICLVRDGRDVLVSMTLRYLREDSGRMLAVAPGMTAVRDAYRADPESVVAEPGRLLADEAWVRDRARLWSGRVIADLEALDHLRQNGTPTLLLSYEDLHADTLAGRDACYRLLGLDPSDAAPISGETKTTPGFGRAEDLTSFYRAGRVGDWRRHFTQDTARWFQEEAAEALARFEARARAHPTREIKPASALMS